MRTIWLQLALSLIALPGAADVPADTSAIQVLSGYDTPNTFLNTNNRPAGNAVNAVTNFLSKTELSYEIKIVPWARALNRTLSDDKTVIFNISRTAERENLFHWIFVASEFELSLVSYQQESLETLTEAQIRNGNYRAICEMYPVSESWTH